MAEQRRPPAAIPRGRGAQVRVEYQGAGEREPAGSAAVAAAIPIESEFRERADSGRGYAAGDLSAGGAGEKEREGC